MNKDIQKLIDDSKNKSYSKLSDNRLNQFEEFTIKGGKASGKLHYKKKTGIFARSESKIKSDASKGGKIGGKVVGAMMRESGHLARICSMGGKIGGKKNVESGHLAKIRIGGGKTSSEKIYKCPHCNKELKGAIYFRWHGDNCKHKK